MSTKELKDYIKLLERENAILRGCSHRLKTWSEFQKEIEQRKISKRDRRNFSINGLFNMYRRGALIEFHKPLGSNKWTLRRLQDVNGAGIRTTGEQGLIFVTG